MRRSWLPLVLLLLAAGCGPVDVEVALSDGVTEPHFATHSLTVNPVGGTHVASIPEGIDCPTLRCVAPFAVGSTVTLVSADGRNLIWGAPCAQGFGQRCDVLALDAPTTVTVSDAPGDE